MTMVVMILKMMLEMVMKVVNVENGTDRSECCDSTKTYFKNKQVDLKNFLLLFSTR